MARYNTSRYFNKKLPKSGANYNSGPFVIKILDQSIGLCIVGDITASANLGDLGIGGESLSLMGGLNILDVLCADDNISAGVDVLVMDDGFGTSGFFISPVNINILDSGKFKEDISLLPTNIFLHDAVEFVDHVLVASNVFISDKTVSIKDSISLERLFNIVDFATSNDYISNPVTASFIIDTHGILHPLGLRVTGDSRHELLPSTRDNTEEIPGRHGEIDFGTEFKAKMIELNVVTNNGYAPLEKAHLQRLFAKYLDPTKGYKTLIFSDDIEKSYMVKYSGKIDITNHPTWLQFVLPFKMSDPFINGTFEKILVGSGKLVNDGTFETGLIVEIAGPATNPSLTIGGETVKYTGTISSGQRLTIDTDRETAKIGSSNAISGYNGAFPLLYPGETSVTASSNITIKWRDKWI